MRCKLKSFLAVLMCCVLAISLFGCSQSKNTSNESSSTGVTSLNLVEDDMFTKRDLNWEYDENSAAKITLEDNNITSKDTSNVTVNDNTVTISEDGVYIISGSLNEGQIIVDAQDDDKIQLVLNGVNINSSSSAAIYIKQADKVFITLADSTENTLTNSGEFVAVDDNNIDSVIFSKDDLTVNGSGLLTVSTEYGHGIVSKDDMVIAADITVTASRHALSANNSVRIACGNISLIAGKDGINVDSEDDDTTGFIYVKDGNITEIVDDDGMHANNVLFVSGGTVNIKQCYEGLESKEILINDGNISIVASDDALNASSGKNSTSDSNSQQNVTDSESGGNPPEIQNSQQNNEDNTPPQMPNENQNNNKQSPPEKPNDSENSNNDANGNNTNNESNAQLPSNGNQNKPSGNVPNEQQPGGGQGTDMDYDESCSITVNGGVININADGDGIDSNGDLYVNGGEIYVSGPSNDGNGALDYSGTATITGGTVIAVGGSGMAQNFGNDSTQCSLLINLSEWTQDDVVVKNSSGEIILTYAANKKYDSVVISSSVLKQNETYTVNGKEITISSVISSNSMQNSISDAVNNSDSAVKSS